MEGKRNLDMLSNVNAFLELFPNQTRKSYPQEIICLQG
jgi:hypothetical protein